MKYLIILIFSFNYCITFGQDKMPIGVGILNINAEKVREMRFYSDTNDKAPLNKFSINPNLSLNNETAVLKWLNPEAYKTDYGIFLLRVETMAGKWCRVYVNTNKGFLWTKVTKNIQYYTWQYFLVNKTTGVESDQELKSTPSLSSKTIKKLATNDSIEAVEIKGDWLKVRTNTKFIDDEKKPKLKPGWIRWSINERLAIQYFLTC